MGTDIHLYAEQWSGDNWILATGIEKNKRNDPVRLDVGRNYDLFAVLAGVRNRNDIEPISLPKGLPNDVCSEIRDKYASWEDDSHSSSWLFAEELYSYDWERVLQQGGVVDQRAEHLFRDNPLGFPSDKWPAGVERWGAPPEGVYVCWRETLGDLCNWGLLKSEIEALGTHERIRLVFWFDN